MTPLHWILALGGLVVWTGLGAALFYTVYAMVRGLPTVSGYMTAAPRWVVAAFAYAIGLVTGILFSHWWFPTVGGML